MWNHGRQPMPRQVCVGRVHQTKQLFVVTLELEPSTQQLQVFAHHRRRPLAERIGVLIGYHGVILASHVAFVAYREPWRPGDTYLFYEFNEHTSKLDISTNGFDTAALARNAGGF
jgi:hypothetical protein